MTENNNNLPQSHDSVWEPDDYLVNPDPIGVAIMLSVYALMWWFGGIAFGWWIWA